MTRYENVIFIFNILCAGRESTFFREIQSSTRLSMQSDDSKLKDAFDKYKKISDQNQSQILADGAVPGTSSYSKSDQEEGALDIAQFKQALHDVGYIADDQFFNDVFKQYDADGNGCITLDEFKCAVRSTSESLFPNLAFRKELEGLHT
jgi:hypothetical protein